jgi:hypothetical protein
MSANASETAEFTVLEYKAPAPFEGVLFNDAAMAKVLSSYDIAAYACEIKTDYELGLLKEEYKFKLDNLKIEHASLIREYDLFIESKDKEIGALVNSLEKTSPRYKWLWFMGGIAVGGISYYTIDKQLSK